MGGPGSGLFVVEVDQRPLPSLSHDYGMMPGMYNELYSGQPLSEYFHIVTDRAKKEVLACGEAEPEAWERAGKQQGTIAETQLQLAETGTEVGEAGEHLEVVVTVPYSGGAVALAHRGEGTGLTPRPVSPGLRRGSAGRYEAAGGFGGAGRILFQAEFEKDTPAGAIKAWRTAVLEDLDRDVESHNREIAAHNAEIERYVAECVAQRQANQSHINCLANEL